MELLQVLVPCLTRCLGEIALGFEILEWVFIFEEREHLLRGVFLQCRNSRGIFFFFCLVGLSINSLDSSILTRKKVSSR